MAIHNYSTPRATSWLASKPGTKIITFVVIPLLLVAALVLPPIAIPQRILDAGSTAVTTAGATITDPDGTNVTFVQGTVKQPFRVKVSTTPRVTFLEGSAGNELLAAAKAIPTHLIAKSPFYQVTTRSQAEAASVWVVPIPNDSEPFETLDAYTWDTASQSWQWLPRTIIVEDDQVESRLSFIPTSIMIVQTNPMPASVSVDLRLAGALPQEGQGAIAQVQPTGLMLGDNGSLSGALDASFDRKVGAAAIVPTIRNYDGPVVRSDLLANMLIDPAQRAAHVDALVNLAVGNLYAGIDIDYRGLGPEDRASFNSFIEDLGSKLDKQNKTLSVRVEAPVQIAEDRWNTGAYDWQALGLLADRVKVPAPLDPRAYVPGGQTEALLNYAVGQINRYKLEIVLSGRSIEQAGNYLLTKSYADALQPLVGRIEADKTVVEPGKPLNLALVSTRPNSGLVYDPNLGTYVYRYQDDQGNARTVWLENAASLSHKLQGISRFGIAGFSLENLPADGMDPDLWMLVRDYQQGSVKPIDSNIMVEWTVRGSDGQQISQVKPIGSASIQIAAPANPGELSVKAAVVDRGRVLREENSSGLAVATYTPVATPTPTQTATPSATSTPAYAQISVSEGTVNVRSGPAATYAKIGDVKPGESYRVMGKSEPDGWYQIAYNDDQKGWVSKDLVQVSGALDTVAVVKAPTAAPQPTSPPQSAQAKAEQPAALPPAPRPSGGGSFGYGMQADPYGNNFGHIKAAGFSWVKVQVPWKDFEGSKGSKGFPDDVVGRAQAAGLNMLASIVKAPNWARSGAYGYAAEGPPQNPQDYADYVGAFAGHFCGKVQAIEVWNEQNLWYEWGNEPLSAARYVQLLAAAYRSIKAACPGMIVVSGAPTPTGATPPLAIRDTTFLEQMYQAGLKNYSDAIGSHPSGFANPPDVTVQDWQAGRYKAASHANDASFYFRNTLEQYRNIMVKYGDGNKRIWLTEFGWGSTSSPHPGYEYEARVSEQQQAAWLVQAYQLMKSWGYVGVAFLWNLDYNVTASSTELAAFGILGRPAYGALAAMPK